MLNDGSSRRRIDPLRSGVVLGARGWSAMLPSFVSASQAVDRLARLEQAQSASLRTDGAGSMRLERTGYRLVVGTERLAGVIAGWVWSIARALMKQGVMRRRSARPSACGNRTSVVARGINAPSVVLQSLDPVERH
jgi:hypothetical protein